MRCEDCGGRGMLAVLAPGDNGRLTVKCELPCPSCGGTGITSCCEGSTGLACDVTNEGNEKAGASSPGRPDGER
jgi:hypothetical protein